VEENLSFPNAVFHNTNTFRLLSVLNPKNILCSNQGFEHLFVRYK